MKIRTLACASLLAALAGSAGCASVRGSVMNLSNRNLVGETAPELADEHWVNADSTPDPDVADWRLLVFFKPT